MNFVGKIVLITSGQPSINPRLVKEADTLASIGFEVIVIYQYWNDWATSADLTLMPKKKWTALLSGGSPKVKMFQYIITKIKYTLSLLLVKHIGFECNFGELALKRNVDGLIKTAKAIKADLYIAHNLSALPAAVIAAKKNIAKCGFDAEDFHRQEQTDDHGSLSYRLSKFIEDKYLGEVNYLTAASPLIAAAYKNTYANLNPITINNVFPFSLIQEHQAETNIEGLNVFWFSQTIGKKRGIEDAIKAIGSLKQTDIKLSLLGKINDADKSYFIHISEKAGLDKKQLIFIPPIPPDEIFKVANNYDIGLALEPGFCLNNDIALSNKIFAYLISGLTVIASETTAQKKFLNDYPEVGRTYRIGAVEELANLISMYYYDRNLLYKAKLASSALAKEKMNWEVESKKFIDLIHKTLLN